MNRSLYWSIYGGSILLAGMLIAASVMAVVGFVPFRSAQPILASAADRDSVAAGLSSPPSHDVTRADEARRDDTGGWDTVWQASAELTAAGMRPVSVESPIHDVGHTQISAAEEMTHANPDEAVVRAIENRSDRSKPQPPSAPQAGRPAAPTDRPVPDSTSGSPPVVAGLWPVVQPSTQADSDIDEPAEDPVADEPTENNTPDGGGAGDTDRDHLDSEPSDGSLRLSLMPSHGEVSAGEIVSVQVVLSEADHVSSVPFHIRFNHEVLEYVGAKSGPAIVSRSLQPILLASVNPARPDDLGVGLALVRSSGRFSGSGTVVVLDFRALQAGHSDLMLEKASVRDAHGRPLTVQIESSTLAVR